MGQINKRKNQIEHQYELLRSVLISKLANYRQQLIMEGNGIMDSISNDALNMSKVFVVHGHNGEMKEAVARLIERQGLQAVILHEKANQGATIIEKFERNSDVSCAICLFTADDFGRAKAAEKETKRARQNVVFEAGYFIGKLGRDHVTALVKGDVETPGDISGVVYTEMDKAGAWKMQLARNMQDVGLDIDMNTFLR
jgi:predicted nucleotide-binding protein